MQLSELAIISRPFMSYNYKTISYITKLIHILYLVLGNIAHSTSRAQLIAHTTKWEFPEHVDAYVNLVFLLLAEEVKP